MSLSETKEASDTLRRYTKAFEQSVAAGKNVEARTYLPAIRQACELLGLNWRELLGNDYNRFFMDVTVNNGYNPEPLTVVENEKKPQITVITDISGCLSCGKDLKGRRKGTKYCDNQCKNNYHQT